MKAPCLIRFHQKGAVRPPSLYDHNRTPFIVHDGQLLVVLEVLSEDKQGYILRALMEEVVGEVSVFYREIEVIKEG